MSDEVFVTVTQSPDHARVVLNGEVVAESDRTLLVRQSDHDFDSRYFPPDDVRLDRFERSETVTFCKHRGEASYRSARFGALVVPDVAWVYEQPVPAIAEITGYVAFFDFKVELSVEVPPGM
ncbi:MAG: DUF427 domain-containing protein [Thermoleophilia bacterium]